jgi:hypothetical protein
LEIVSGSPSSLLSTGHSLGGGTAIVISFLLLNPRFAFNLITNFNHDDLDMTKEMIVNSMKRFEEISTKIKSLSSTTTIGFGSALAISELAVLASSFILPDITYFVNEYDIVPRMSESKISLGATTTPKAGVPIGTASGEVAILILPRRQTTLEWYAATAGASPRPKTAFIISGYRQPDHH